jgi:hypothetical protein
MKMLRIKNLFAILAVVFAIGATSATLGACGDDGHDHQHDVGDGDGDGD